MTKKVPNDGLAMTLRTLRKELGLTLAQVAQRTGIPASTLSKVENGKLTLSYDKLQRLSHGLEIDITRLFKSVGPPPPVGLGGSNRRSVERHGDGHSIQTSTYNHRYLATDLLQKQFDPIIAEPRARSMEEFGEWIRHEGEEFCYVLEGEIIFCSEVYAPVHLMAGDTVYFDSAMGHAYLKASDRPSRFLSVCRSVGTDLRDMFPEARILDHGNSMSVKRKTPADKSGSDQG